MGYNKININSRILQSQVQTIAGEMAEASISPKKYEYFSKKLNRALASLQSLEAKKAVDLFSKNLGEQVVKLYGDLEDGLVKQEVSKIEKWSSSLKEGRISNKAIKKLETHIHELESNHLTLCADRRIIEDAKKALLDAKEKLAGKPVTRHFDWLAQQTTKVQFVDESFLPGDVEELLDIARAIYNRDVKQAKMRYYGLPEEHKQIFQKHMQTLMAIPFDEPMQTAQALIATVNEIVHNGEGIPSESKVIEFFTGLIQLGFDERKKVSFAG